MNIASPKTLFFIFIAIAIIIEIIADILFKKWTLTNKTSFIVLGMILYATGTLFWAISLKYE